jgi:hypothetical protein
MKSVILVLVIAAAAGFGLLNYHFIVFDDTFKILRKTGVRYENTFVDARGSKKYELVLKPDLVAAGFQDLLNKANSPSASE